MPITFYATNNFTGNGSTTNWNINFADGYLSTADVKARYVGPTGEFIDIPITSVAGNVVTISPALPNGVVFSIYRDTQKSSPLVDYVDGAILNETNLDVTATQGVMVAAEAYDLGQQAILTSTQASADVQGAVDDAADAVAAVGDAVAAADAAAASAAQAAADASTAITIANSSVANADEALDRAIDAQSDAAIALNTANAAVPKVQGPYSVANSPSEGLTVDHDTLGNIAEIGATISFHRTVGGTSFFQGANAVLDTTTGVPKSFNGYNIATTGSGYSLSGPSGLIWAATDTTITNYKATSLATGSTMGGSALLTAATGAPLNSPALTGNPTAPTAIAGDNDTTIATTAFVTDAVSTAVAPLAPKASPALTGVPTAPTAALGTNTTQIATTAFVLANGGGGGGGSGMAVMKETIVSASGAFTFQTGSKYAEVIIVSGGGGSGGVATPTAGNVGWSQPGSASIPRTYWIDLSVFGVISSATATIGAGGSGGSAGIQNGTDGGATILSITGSLGTGAINLAGASRGSAPVNSTPPVYVTFASLPTAATQTGILSASPKCVLLPAELNGYGSGFVGFQNATSVTPAPQSLRTIVGKYGSQSDQITRAAFVTPSGYGSGGITTWIDSGFGNIAGGAAGPGVLIIKEYG